MGNGPQLGEAIEGYVVLAKELLDDWTPYLTGTAAKVTSGAYDPQEASADFSVLAKLVADSLLKIGSEAVDALAILTSDFDEHSVVGGYKVTTPQKSAAVLSLRLKGDLTSVSGQVLPRSKVTLVPDELVWPAVDFELAVDSTGVKARTYDGFVVVTDPAGVVVEEIFVSRTVG